MESLIFFSFVIIIIYSLFSFNFIFADVLSNSLRQRIGDYDIQINTVPSIPISGKETKVNIRITTVSNNPITDTPIVLRISDEKKELTKTHPILLSSGHYTYYYIFNKAGVFLFSIDILANLDTEGSNDSNTLLTFDFPLNVSGPVSAELTSLTIPITAAAMGSVIAIVFMKKFKNLKRAF